MGKERQERTTVNVLFIAAEADPFVKIGGLGDVAGSLPAAIRKICAAGAAPVDVDIRLVIPYYPQLKESVGDVTPLGEYAFTSGNEQLTVQVYQTTSRGVPVYLLDGDPIRNGGRVYSNQADLDAEKFIFFTLACVKLPEFLHWDCQIIHANDWHTALAPYVLKALPAFRKPKIKTILSVHNLPFLGEGCQPCMTAYQIPPYPFGLLPSWAQHLPLPMGLSTADRIIPVSPGYAREIQTPEYGSGLEKLLQSRARQIVGIVNGIDVDAWNPASDSLLPHPYSSASISEKIGNKKAVLESLGMPFDPNTPLLVVISRMDYQKGIDLAVSALANLLDISWRAIILGSGDAAIEQKCREFAKQYPDRMQVMTGFHAELAHRLYAGADIFLMPSRYEPCGISQMIAMRYGTIPVARATGGLKDTIQAVQPEKTGTGYLFEEASPVAFSQALKTALADFANRSRWQEIQLMAMKMDFSWDASALKYIQQYVDLVRIKQPAGGRKP